MNKQATIGARRDFESSINVKSVLELFVLLMLFLNVFNSIILLQSKVVLAQGSSDSVGCCVTADKCTMTVQGDCDTTYNKFYAGVECKDLDECVEGCCIIRYNNDEIICNDKSLKKSCDTYKTYRSVKEVHYYDVSSGECENKCNEFKIKIQSEKLEEEKKNEEVFSLEACYGKQEVTRKEAVRQLINTLIELGKMKNDLNKYRHGPYSSPFKDVNLNSPYFPYIRKAYDEKIIVGYPDKTFRPERALTRAELITLILKASYLREDKNGLDREEVKSVELPDDSKNHWAADLLKYALYVGLIIGYPDGTIKPDKKANCQELLWMLQNLRDFYTQDYPKIMNVRVNPPGGVKGTIFRINLRILTKDENVKEVYGELKCNSETKKIYFKEDKNKVGGYYSVFDSSIIKEGESPCDLIINLKYVSHGKEYEKNKLLKDLIKISSDRFSREEVIEEEDEITFRINSLWYEEEASFFLSGFENKPNVKIKGELSKYIKISNLEKLNNGWMVNLKLDLTSLGLRRFQIEEEEAVLNVIGDNGEINIPIRVVFVNDVDLFFDAPKILMFKYYDGISAKKPVFVINNLPYPIRVSGCVDYKIPPQSIYMFLISRESSDCKYFLGDRLIGKTKVKIVPINLKHISSLSNDRIKTFVSEDSIEQVFLGCDHLYCYRCSCSYTPCDCLELNKELQEFIHNFYVTSMTYSWEIGKLKELYKRVYSSKVLIMTSSIDDCALLIPFNSLKLESGRLYAIKLSINTEYLNQALSEDDFISKVDVSIDEIKSNDLDTEDMLKKQYLYVNEDGLVQDVNENSFYTLRFRRALNDYLLVNFP